MDKDDTTWQLPDETQSHNSASKSGGDHNHAADLIRRKVEAAYSHEPSVSAEAQDLAGLGPKVHRSKHQKFIEELTSSGKSLAEIQLAWHDYYVGLADLEKHQVWQEFYNIHGQTPSLETIAQRPRPQSTADHLRQALRRSKRASGPISQTLAELRNNILGNGLKLPKVKAAKPMHSLLFGLGVGAIVIVVFLFSFFNERIVAPFIQPSRNIANLPLISDGAVSGTDQQIIIPKINVQIPVVYGVKTVDEVEVNKGLEKGVVHYADTALPGQGGNVVVIGHSSNNIFNTGKYKFAFVLLSRLENGDTFYLNKDGKRYTYQVYQKKIVEPNDVSVLGTTEKPASATLITCDPPGTSTNRLIVVGQQISPDPNTNSPQVASNTLATQAKVIPSNAPSLWSRLIGWLSV